MRGNGSWIVEWKYFFRSSSSVHSLSMIQTVDHRFLVRFQIGSLRWIMRCASAFTSVFHKGPFSCGSGSGSSASRPGWKPCDRERMHKDHSSSPICIPSGFGMGKEIRRSGLSCRSQTVNACIESRWVQFSAAQGWASNSSGDSEFRSLKSSEEPKASRL